MPSRWLDVILHAVSTMAQSQLQQSRVELRGFLTTLSLSYDVRLSVKSESLCTLCCLLSLFLSSLVNTTTYCIKSTTAIMSTCAAAFATLLLFTLAVLVN